jgi:hypothetical protein
MKPIVLVFALMFCGAVQAQDNLDHGMLRQEVFSKPLEKPKEVPQLTLEEKNAILQAQKNIYQLNSQYQSLNARNQQVLSEAFATAQKRLGEGYNIDPDTLAVNAIAIIPKVEEKKVVPVDPKKDNSKKEK